MNAMKYVVLLGSLISLLIGFVIISLKNFYQNLILSYLCSTLYTFGPNAGCDLLMGLPDFGLIFLFFGLIGILYSFVSLLQRDIEG